MSVANKALRTDPSRAHFVSGRAEQVSRRRISTCTATRCAPPNYQRRLWLVRGKAVEQAVAARAFQRVLAAAAAGPARGMRRVPGFRGVVVAQALAVMMADHGGALGAARPVLAGHVGVACDCPTVGRGPGQNVVHVRRVAAAVDGLALLAQRGLLVDLVSGAVKVVDVLRDRLALGVHPRPAPDAIARVDGRLPAGGLGAEIGVPGAAARARGLRQRLAVLVGPGQAAEIGSLS